MTGAPVSTGRQNGQGRLRGHLSDPLYRTGYLLIAGAGIGSLLGFVFWSFAAHAYSTRAVGLNSAAISAMMFVSGACQLGLNAVLVRYVPTAGARARAFVLRSYVLTVAVSLLIGALAAGTTELWSPSLSFLGSSAEWLFGFTVSTAMWTVFTLQDSVMTGLQAARWVPLENTLFNLAKLVLLAGLAGLSPFAGPFVAWNAPCVLAVLAVTWLIFRRLIPATRRQPSDPRTAGVPGRRQLVGAAAGNYAGTLCSLAVTFLMPVLVANSAGPNETAYFYAPWTIMYAVTLVAVNTTTSLTVEAALDESRLFVLARRTLTHTMRLLIPIALLTIVAAPLILRAFGSHYAHAGAGLLRLLALGTVPSVLVSLGIAVARIQHRGHVVLAIQVAQSVPQLALSAWLLPSIGIVAVGLTYAFSQTIVAAALLASLLRPLVSR